MTDFPSATLPDQVLIGGELPVNRLGFGTMQLTGPGTWGPPRDPDAAIAVLRRAAELGVTFFDTADAYGPGIVEPLIRQALEPLYDDIVIATKAGTIRPRPGEWDQLGRPTYLRQQCELSLRNLGLEQIPLYYLHRVDPTVPLADQVGELKALRDEGKIAHIGLSEVTVAQIDEARSIAPIASVQNLYNLANRSAEDVVSHCERHNIVFVPWFPLATGGLTGPDGPMSSVASRLSATPSQIALAWLLHRSPVMLPIPGTSSVAHLEENLGAASIELTSAELFELAGNV